MRKMKDSGIEWIGQIPEDWETIKIKYVVTPIKSGGTPDSDNDRFYAEEGIPWVAISDMSTSSYVFDTEKHITEEGRKSKNLLIFPTGTLLYSIYATVGKVSQLKIPACINQAILALIPHEDIYLTAFLKYNLKAIEDYVYSQSSGNTQFNLNAHKVNNFPIVSPDFETQKRIADFLDEKCGKIDRYIEKQQQVIEKLKAYKQSVITEAVTKGINPDVPMKDSGLKYKLDMPAHWENRKVISILAMRVVDGAHESPELFDEGVPYISATAIVNGKIDFSQKRGFISPEYCDICDQRYVPHLDDILMIKLGASTGQVAMVETTNRFNIWVPLAAIRCNESAYPKFVYYAFQSDYFIKQMELSWTYGTQQTLGVKTIERLRILIPSVEEQKQIADYLTERCKMIDASIEKYQQIVDKLTVYKKSLIYEAVTGKLEV